jgi:hypothetical protein
MLIDVWRLTSWWGHIIPMATWTVLSTDIAGILFVVCLGRPFRFPVFVAIEAIARAG